MCEVGFHTCEEALSFAALFEREEKKSAVAPSSSNSCDGEVYGRLILCMAALALKLRFTGYKRERGGGEVALSKAVVLFFFSPPSCALVPLSLCFASDHHFKCKAMAFLFFLYQYWFFVDFFHSSRLFSFSAFPFYVRQTVFTPTDE